MKITDLSLEGPKLLYPDIFRDERGFFRELYRSSLYQQAGITCAFVQDNHSFSKKHTVRGMHFQQNPGQAKLVSVMEGVIFDVIVDIRLESPTLGQWEGVYLSGDRGEQLWIPIGFAHGFCVVSDTAHVVYKVSSVYNAAEEKTFCFNDPDLQIQWPVVEPILSDKDRNGLPFKAVLGL